MNLNQDHEKHQLQPLPQHARNRNHRSCLPTSLSKPKAYISLAVFSAFILGYICRSQISDPARSLAPNNDLPGQWALSFHNNFSSKCASPVPPNEARKTIINQVFHGTSPWDNFPPPHVSPHLQNHWTMGWGSTNPIFERLIRQTRPNTIIEVGTFLGMSATHMAGLARRLGLETQIICVDDFRGWPADYDTGKSLETVNGDSMLLYQFMQNVVSVNETSSIIYMPFSTGMALNELCKWGVYGDLVEVDAAHDFHSAWADINRAYKVLRPGGVLFGHDYAWVGVRAAVDLFADMNGFRVRLDDEHWILY